MKDVKDPASPETVPAAPRTTLPPIPWLAVGSALVASCGLLAATANRFGYFADELYFRMVPPDWGYVDQPPLTPLLIRGSIAVFGDNPVGLRVPAILLAGLGVLLSVLLTRELGGGRLAQALGAWGVGFSTYLLGVGHLMLTVNADMVAWAATLLCVVRAQLRAQPRWWLVAGVVIGLATYNKLLILMLVASLAVGLLLSGPRSVLREPRLWAGAAIALILAAPNLIYQMSHGFPQVMMAAALNAMNAETVRTLLLPMQILQMGPFVIPVWIAGLVALWRRVTWRPVRFVGVAYLVALVLTFVGGGQLYYAMGLQACLLAAGFVPVARWLGAAAWRVPAAIGALVLHAVTSVAISLPVTPPRSFFAAINPTVPGQLGWPGYVEQLAAVYYDLPESERRRAVIFAGNYAEAGAVHRFGPEHGLPDVYSGHNQLWFLGPPREDRTVVVAWYWQDERIAPFTDCVVKATLHNDERVGREDGSRVAVCHVPATGWAGVWPQLQFYGTPHLG